MRQKEATEPVVSCKDKFEDRMEGFFQWQGRTEELEAKKGRWQSQNRTLDTALNDNKVSGKNLKSNVKKEKLSSTAVLKEFRNVKNDL